MLLEKAGHYGLRWVVASSYAIYGPFLKTLKVNMLTAEIFKFPDFKISKPLSHLRLNFGLNYI
jgi:hypothetical protein